MELRKDDKAIEGLLRRSLARDSAAQPCPEPDVLAAYFEQSLTPDETERCDLHFSQCARCREQLAAMASMGEAETDESHAPSATKEAPRTWALGWNWLAPVAVLVSFALVWFIRYRVQTRTTGHTWTDGLVAVMKPQPSPSTTPLVTLPNASPSAPPTDKALQEPAHDKVGFAQHAPSTSDLKKDTTRASSTISSADQGAVPAAVDGYAGAPSRVTASERAAPQASARLIAPTPQSALRVPSKIASASELAKVVPGPKPQPAATANPGATQKEAPIAVAQTVEVTAEAPVVANGVPGQAASASAAKTEAQQKDSLSAQQSAQSLMVMDESEATEVNGKLKQPVKEYSKSARTKTSANSPNLVSAQAMPGYVLIATPDPSVVWRIAPEGFVERSMDSAATWEGTQISSEAQFLAGSAPTANTCWVVGRGGSIFMTKDGKHWKKIHAPAAIDFVSVSAMDAAIATVTAADGTKYATSNGGKNWQQVQ